jgi:hypothetical protein
MSRRTLTALEFVGPEGIRLGLDEDGWRLINPRNMGESALERARALLEKIEQTPPPANEDGSPHDLFQLGDHAAKTFGLRNTQRKFRQRR